MSSSASKLLGLIACVPWVLLGCGKKEKPTPPPQPQLKHVPRTPIDKKKAELGENTWDPQWSRIVEQALPPSLLSARVPRDVRVFCPRFYVMSPADKRAFWAYFFQALAGAEAGLNPRADVPHTEVELARQEKVPETKVRTEGLLQLTYADQQRYGCPFDRQADRTLPLNDPKRTILQPKNNLLCGIRILENQFFSLHRPLLWDGSYWATLRPGTFSYRVFARQMTNPPAACGIHVPRRKPASHKEIAQ